MKADDVKITMLYSDANGIYIPQMFCKELTDLCVNGDGSELTEEMKATIAELAEDGSETSEWYWESWETILNRVYIREKDTKDRIYSLYHMGDLYAFLISDLEQLNEEETEEFWSRFDY